MQNKIRWTSPSNIAIVKYWGKREQQIPMNPSLSFTLSHCKTNTSIEWSEKKNSETADFSFYYEGKPKPEFEEKIGKYLYILRSELPALKDLNLKIDSANTFPHSAGIASSASAMSALALCLLTLDYQLRKIPTEETEFLNRASYLARLGSGSASRSVYPLASLWGQCNSFTGSSDDFAIPMASELHPSFQQVCDCIFIVNKNEKEISSRAGHQLMDAHPYREARIEQAVKNIDLLNVALKTGNWNSFIAVCEEEALSLHALMMSSIPGYVLLEPDSLRLISEIRKFRNSTNLPIAFTIDAGPNIHLLYPADIEGEIEIWMQKVLPDYWTEKKYILDRIGNGPQRILE